MAKRIDFDNRINSDIQIGDYAWVADIDASNGVTTTTPILIGTITDKSTNYIIVDDTNFLGVVNVNSFIMFSKPIEVNKSSVQGYYADVTLKNTSNKRVELFAISSEVTTSSK